MGTWHEHRFPGESAAYRKARDELLAAEIALRRQIETVAAMRRELPPGGLVDEDFRFEQAGGGEVALSALFDAGKDSLVVYGWMFPPGGRPCPSCTSILDGLDGAAPHVGQRVNLVAVGKAPADELARFAALRGWRHLRLLSSGGNGFGRAYGAETESGAQMPMINVFRKGPDGIRHVWGSELLWAPSEPGQDPRHADTIWPLWNVFDLVPEGRGEHWQPRLDYGEPG